MLERTAPNYSSSSAQTDSNDISGVKEVMHYNLVFADTYCGHPGSQREWQPREQQHMDLWHYAAKIQISKARMPPR